MLKTLLTIGALQLVTMVILLVRTKVLAVQLGPDVVGLMAVLDKLVAVVVQTVSLSLPYAAARFLPSLWMQDRVEFYRVFRSMTLLLAVLSALACVGGVALTIIRPSIWGTEFASYPTIVAAAFLSLPLVAFAPYLQNAFAGTMRHRSSMFFSLAHAAVQTIAALIGAAAGSLAVLYVAYAGAAAALIGPALSRLFRLARPTPTPPLTLGREAFPPLPILRFSAALFALSALAPYAALYAHYLILSRDGAVTAGWMQAALGVALAVRAVLGAAHPIYLTPQVNKGGTAEERLRWAAQFQNTWCLLAGILVPPVLLAPNLVVHALYAESFRPAAEFVYLFVLCEIVTLLAGTYGALIVAFDRMFFHVAQNMVAQAILIVVAWWLIPFMGIAGAAMGAIAGQVFLFLNTSAYLARRFRLRPPIRTTVLTIYLLIALTLAGIYGARGISFSLTDFGRSAAAYALILLGLALFLTRDERLRVRDSLRSILRRARGNSKRD